MVTDDEVVTGVTTSRWFRIRRGYGGGAPQKPRLVTTVTTFL